MEKRKKFILLTASRWWHYGLKKYMIDNCIGDNNIVKSYNHQHTIANIDGKVCVKPVKTKTKYDIPTKYWQLSNGEIIELEFSTKCKDIQGIEIFENDIVEYKLVGNKGDKTQKLIRDIVIIDANIPCFRTKRLNKNTLYSFGKSLYNNVETIKVIGNIHENSELVSNLTNNHRKDKQCQ